MRVRSRLALLFALLTFGAYGIQAQQFYWDTASTRSSGMGGVYVASSSDVVDALASNPAGLSFLRDPTLNLEAAAIFARGSFQNSSNPNAPLKDSPGVVPYGAFGMPIKHSRFTFGVGMTPELLSRGDWRYVDAPGFAGATYGSQEQFSEIYALRFAVGLAYAVNSRLSVGATLGADYNSNRLQAPYIFQSQPVLRGLKTLLNMHTTGYGWNGSLGVVARPIQKLEIGISWKSRTVIDSTGQASGDAYAQFTALGVSAPSSFTYNAKVRNVLPQTVNASLAWQASPQWLVALQVDWVNWRDSFVALPVTLTNGTNATVNGLAGGTILQDSVPLDWRDQYVFHIGAERALTESLTLRAGYSHANRPVPSSTLTPLTAAIFTDQVSTGVTYRHGRAQYEAAYAFGPQATGRVAQSGLRSGEYDNSSVRVGAQSVKVGVTYRF